MMAALGSFFAWSIICGTVWLLSQLLGNGITRKLGGKPKGIGLGSVIFGLLFFPLIIMLWAIAKLLKQS